jgi:uncharacterized glyoxalase superfamily protein PhnB
MQNRSMPPCTIIPVIGYFNISEAIDWLSKHFNFTERWRAGTHRAQLSYEGGAIAITGLEPDAIFIPYNLLVRVANVDEHYKNVQQRGIEILNPPADYPFGERQYTVADLNGHRWTFSQSIKDTAPEDWGAVSTKL